MARIRLAPGQWGDVQLKELDDGRYRARVLYCNAAGELKRVQRIERNKTAARNAANAAAEEAARRGVGIDVATATVRDLVSEYLAWGRKHKWRPQTADQYDHAAKHLIYPRCGRLRAVDATTALMETALQGISTVSGRRVARVVLLGAFTRGVRRGTVATNPVSATTPVSLKPARPKSLTPNEIQTIRGAVRAWQEKDRPGRKERAAYLLNFLDVLIGSGARPNEVLALTWPCVDVATRQITIQATVSRHKDENGKSRLFMQDTPKTARGYRTITLPDWAIAAIELQALNPFAADGGALTTPQGLVFPSTTGGLLDLANVRRTLRDALKPTGLEFHPYLTRSTALTAISETYGLLAARDVAGHTSTAITEAHYVQRAPVAGDVSGALGDFRPLPS